MASWMPRVRTPVRREGAQTLLLLVLLSFGASVVLTRLFLQLAGFPQLGGGELHIAHVLWGGLLLFIAALLPLIFANRWVYTAGAILAGLGVGLFIDEVGKFITQANDYFYPAAAPIIYAFFLLTVMLYVQIRRPQRRNPRAELYRALEAFEEILDHDLEEDEQEELKERLSYVVQHSKDVNLARVAQEMFEAVSTGSLQVAPDSQGVAERLLARAQRLEKRLLPRTRAKAVLIGGLSGLGVVALVSVGTLVLATLSPGGLDRLVARLVGAGQVTSTAGLNWFLARAASEAVVGILLLSGGVLLLLGREQTALRSGYYGLLLALTTVNVLIFYFDQFSTILPAMIELTLLMGVLRYRRRFLRRRTAVKTSSAKPE